MEPSLMAGLGWVVALAMVGGSGFGLAACEGLAGELGGHRWFAVRARLLEDAGEVRCLSGTTSPAAGSDPRAGGWPDPFG
ncbi:hypothetical protein DMH08_32350 [Actinomadura sp. WAC 06369]|nr:hypothetical protein DMH08_32350 [Actinomadura sp. WAC 06369]